MLRQLICLCLLCTSAIYATAASDIARLGSEIDAGRHSRIQAFVLLRNDEAVQQVFPDSFQRKPPDIRSATKSITAILVGIALDQGYLKSLDQRVIELLPEYATELATHPAKSAMTLRDLLTMRSGLDCDDWNPRSVGHEDLMYRTRDWIRFWASAPVQRPPGDRFSYCTGNVIALGRILAHATHLPVNAFAERELFAPLGIRHARWATWNRGADTDSGGHLRIHPRDLATIGLLVLNGGRHEGKQLLSRSWIDAMTAVHTDIPDRPQQYGFLWWIDRIRSPQLAPGRIWMAWGNGGNFLVLFPEQQAVAVFSGTRFNRPDALEPLLWLRDRVLPELVVAP